MKTTKVNPGFYEEAAPAPTEIVLKIDGLRPLDDGTFALTGVRPIEMFEAHRQMEATMEILQAQGVSRALAIRLCEEAFQSIEFGLLADAIAQRTTRVG